MAPELHLNSYTWVQDEKLGFQSRLSQNRNVGCVLSSVLFWIGEFWLMSVLEERKTVRCHRISTALCRVTAAKDTGVLGFCWIWVTSSSCGGSIRVSWQKKRDSKQNLMCPNSNLQKQITLPEVNAAIGKVNLWLSFSFQSPNPYWNPVTLHWYFGGATILFPISFFSLTLFCRVSTILAHSDPPWTPSWIWYLSVEYDNLFVASVPKADWTGSSVWVGAVHVHTWRLELSVVKGSPFSLKLNDLECFPLRTELTVEWLLIQWHMPKPPWKIQAFLLLALASQEWIFWAQNVCLCPSPLQRLQN